MATFYGTPSTDTISGTDSGDTIYGYANGANPDIDVSDILSGLGGNDTIHGGGGQDQIDGGLGIDTMHGGIGDDTYIVDGTWLGGFNFAVDQVIEEEGEGLDTVKTGHFAYTLTANVENLEYTGSSTFTGKGNELGNIITGGAGADTLYGFEGNDTLDGKAGADAMYGGYGDDGYFVDDVGDSVGDIANASGGIDEVRTQLATYVLPAYIENLTFHTGAVVTTSFTGTGNAGDNDLVGNGGDDTLTGLDGNDFIDGLGGADHMEGGKGDDVYYVDVQGDQVIELAGAGSGKDAVYVARSYYKLPGNVETGFAILKSAAVKDTLIGNELDNELTGLDGNHDLIGLGGADKLIGSMSGYDATSYADSDAGVAVSLTAGTGAGGHAQGDTFVSIEHVTGSAFDDTLIGDAKDNVLEGGAGDDTLDGKGGNDSVSYQSATAGVAVDLALATAQDTGGAGIDTLVSIEFLTGSAFDDVLGGHAGFDLLSGHQGNDLLRGSLGADILSGDGGIDTADYSLSSAAVKIELGDPQGNGFGGFAEGDKLYGIENIIGSGFADTLIGKDHGPGDTDNVLEGRGGADHLDGGQDGNDWASYASSAAGVTVNLTTGMGSGVGSHAAGDTLVEIEGLIGSAFDDTLVGSDAQNSFVGGAGNDTIDGKGNPAGNLDRASYASAAAGVVVDLSVATAQDTVGAGIDTLVNIEALEGSAFDDGLAGRAGTDWLQGNQGDDVLGGSLGADTLFGGAGFDTADYAKSNAAVTVDLALKKGTGGLAEGDTLLSIDKVVGSAFADSLIGGSQGDTFEGRAGADALARGAGDDDLFGGEGDDGMRGSTGFDDYDGGAGTDTVNFDLSSGVNVFLDGSGTNGKAALGDTFVDVENVNGSQTGADFLVGDGAANRLTGNGGNDILWGRGGIDILEGGAGNDRLWGGAGNDVLTGGADADAFVFAEAPAAGGVDRTNDFVHLLDKIEIDASAFGGGLVAGGAVQLVANAAPSSAGKVGGVFLYDTDSGFLSWDADGQDAGAAVAFFRLQNLPGLTAADFVVVA